MTPKKVREIVLKHFGQTSLTFQKIIRRRKQMRKLKSAFFAFMGMIMVGNLLFSTIYCRVEGFVKDKDTGKGIPNVKVILFQSITEMDNVKTDANGYFAFKKVDPGEYYYFVCKEDNYVSNLQEYMQKKLFNYFDNPGLREMAGFFTLKEGDIKFFILNLEKGGKIKGKIYQKYANEIIPMTDCIVYLEKEYEETDLVLTSPYLTTPKSIIIDKARIMDNGDFYFSGIKPLNKYSLTIMTFVGFAYQYIKSIEIKKNETIFLDFTFDWGDKTGIKGTVTKSGLPLKSAYIYLMSLPDEEVSADPKTDEEGKYSILMLSPGVYKLSCTYFDSNKTKHKREIKIKLNINEIKIINFEF
jgi:hypothetical protein